MMKAVAVWPARRRVEVVERERPGLGAPDDARIRILDVGVCGTDAEICGFDYGGTPPEGEEYLIVGHEALGEVIETGPGVTGLRSGDLVVPMVRRPCPVPGCPACRSGHPDFCVTGKYTERGIVGAHGFLAEEAVAGERYLVSIPRPLRDVGVLTEPLTIAEKGLRQYLQVRRRLPWLERADDAELTREQHALVLGAGPVGLLGCLLLRLHGFRVTVFARSRAPNPRSEIARSAGATYLSGEERPMAEAAGSLGAIDLVYEAAGASQLAFDTLEHLGPNGIFVFTGVPGRKHRVDIAGDAIMRGLVLRNQTVLGTVNAGRQDFEAAIRDLGRIRECWPGTLEALITGRWPMERFCERAGASDGIKDVIAVRDAA
jgi:threonine dehydrogenase-like Zn-dependent dehydrogenase